MNSLHKDAITNETKKIEAQYRDAPNIHKLGSARAITVACVVVCNFAIIRSRGPCESSARYNLGLILPSHAIRTTDELRHDTLCCGIVTRPQAALF